MLHNNGSLKFWSDQTAEFTRPDQIRLYVVLLLTLYNYFTSLFLVFLKVDIMLEYVCSAMPLVFFHFPLLPTAWLDDDDDDLLLIAQTHKGGWA